MAISFPNNPSLNDTFTSGGITFTWNGTNWVSSKNTTVLSDTTPQLGGNLDLNSQDITGTGDINVTGTITATSFSGDGSALTGAGTTTTAEWTLGADGTSHYTFTGPGVTAGATDPTIYLTRGQTYKFKNRSGGHPFRIQTSFQNTSGTAYNDGITNNAAGNGEDLYWEVRNDTPDTLYYQCTSHTNMSGRINMISGESKVVGLTSTTATARDAGITTATGSIVYVPDVGLQVYAGDAAGWKTIANTSDTVVPPFSATGGDVTVEPGNGYKYHTFLNTGDFVTGPNAGTVEVLIVGGGGGGGDYAGTGNAGGAGGAGGLVHHSALTLSASTTYPIVIGNGGPDSPSPNGTYIGANGDDSTAFGMTAKGGGGGGGYASDGRPGGSGGGGVGQGSATQASQNAPFQPSPDFSQFGNAGGTGDSNAGDFGGGGGAGAAGSPHGGGLGGPGGVGRQYPQFTGNLIGVSNLNPFSGYFAGGGGGGNYPSGAPAPGGLGGGGGPNNNPQSPTDTQPIPGTNGTGGGGAGGSLSHSGGNGGKGIVVIRYPA